MIPQHVAGQVISVAPHRTVLRQESIQAVSPVVRAEEVRHNHVHTKSGRVAPYVTLYKL